MCYKHITLPSKRAINIHPFVNLDIINFSPYPLPNSPLTIFHPFPNPPPPPINAGRRLDISERLQSPFSRLPAISHSGCPRSLHFPRGIWREALREVKEEKRETDARRRRIFTGRQSPRVYVVGLRLESENIIPLVCFLSLSLSFPSIYICVYVCVRMYEWFKVAHHRPP